MHSANNGHEITYLIFVSYGWNPYLVYSQNKKYWLTSRFMTIESAPQRRTWQQAGWWGRVAASIEAGQANSDWPTPPTLWTYLYAQSTNPKGYKRRLYILELLFNISRASPVWFWVDVSQQWRWVKKFDKSSSFTWLKFVSHWLWDEPLSEGLKKVVIFHYFCH